MSRDEHVDSNVIQSVSRPSSSSLVRLITFESGLLGSADHPRLFKSAFINVIFRKISLIIWNLEWVLIHVTMLDSLRYTKLSPKAITNVSNFCCNKEPIPMFNPLMAPGNFSKLSLRTLISYVT